jgi:RHS repeat-associated protein
MKLDTARAMRPSPATAPKPSKDPAPPLIPDCGIAQIDAIADCVNTAAAPFQNAPDPQKGTLGVIEHGIGAVMGVVGAPFQLLDTGFAMATSFIANLLPGFPAAVLGMPHFGPPHGHLHPPSLIPPNPVPVPLPSIGMISVPGAVNVLIGGLPAARAGDIGIAPTCVGLFPLFDIFTGSSNTWIGGSRAARMGDITWHCNPASAMNKIGKVMGAIGVIAGAVSAGAAAAAGDAAAATAAAAQAAADAVALAMGAMLGKDPGIPPTIGVIMMGYPMVLIGGFPMPDTLAALGGILKGLKMLGKAIGKSKALGKLLSKIGLCNSPGEPINPFTGEVYNDFEDYRATDTGFVWERHYRSGWNEQDGPLGYGYRHCLQRTLTFYRKRAVYETHDNEQVALGLNDDGTFQPTAGFSLRRSDSRTFVLKTDRDETLTYTLLPGSPATGRLERYVAPGVDVYLYYDERGRLRALSEASSRGAVDTLFYYGSDGYIAEVHRGVRGQAAVGISRYVYKGGCLVEWYDAVGGVKRFRYDAERRMVQGTDRRGYSFHWEYDPNNGRCIKSYGDDGLWGVEAKYEGSTSTFTEPDGGVWTFKFFPDGVISHIADPLGGIMQYAKDDNGRISRQLLPNGIEVEWVYGLDGKLIHRRDQWSNLIPPEDEAPNLPDPLAYDGPENQRDCLLGRTSRKRATLLTALPFAQQRALEQLGPLFTASTPLPQPKRDLLGRVTEQSHRDGSTEYFYRDAEGNVTARLDTNKQWWLRQIVSWNLLGAEKSPSGAVTQYTYNHREVRRTWIDANGNRSDYSFDLAQQVVEMRHDGAASRRLKRDIGGTVVEVQASDGSVLVKNEIGGHGLRTKSTLLGGEAYAFDYDAFGNCTEASNSEHQVKCRSLRRYFFHPVPARVIEHVDGKGIRHGYDSSQQLHHTVFFERFCIEYRLLGDGKLRVFTPGGAVHDFYTAQGGEQVRDNGNGTVETTVFDADDRLCARLCSFRQRPWDAPHWVACYRYNAENELLEQIDTDIGSVRYGYDTDHRLIAQQDSRGIREYAYDSAGNLTRNPQHRVIERLAGNLLAFTDSERFEYDACSRLAKRIRYDGRITTYAYDGLGQLKEARFSDTEAVWRAGYDGLGRRIWRDYGGERTCFYWDGHRLAAEVTPDGKLRVYVYSNPDAFVPFMWLDYESVDAEPDSGRAFYLFTHGTGMPVRVEDQHGNVVWRAKHIDAYGSVHVDDGACVDLRLRFTGHFLDEHTGLHYNRYRDYDPALGRYLQPDPIDFAGGINLYAYPANPIVDVDLLGLVHKKTVQSTFEPGKKPPHDDIPLHKQTDAQLKDTCKFHADALADIQENVHGKKKDGTR